MTDSASAFMHYLKDEYQRADYPDLKSWAFTPDTPEQRELLPELRGQQLIRRYTESYWGLTERGLAWVLTQLPLSAKALALWGQLKAAYAQAGRPRRRTWTLTPRDPQEAQGYSELRARGYLDAFTDSLYILSAAGVNRSGS